MSHLPQIDVCVCTFRRASLQATLRSLVGQGGATSSHVRVIVADNDDQPSAAALVRHTAAECGLDVLYVHAPARNISIARNACLDNATAPLIAFIDDDETAAAGWLDRLAATLAAGSAAAVFGPVQAIYPPGTPSWLSRENLHSTQPASPDGRELRTGYTCNVLLRRSALLSAGNTRFDRRLGRSGGEDTAFFHALHVAGSRFDYCPHAFVNEPVAAERTGMRWLMRRSFRAGQTHAGVLIRATARNRGQRVLALSVAATKLVYCLARALVPTSRHWGWRRQVIRAMLHAGVTASLSGIKDIQIY